MSKSKITIGITLIILVQLIFMSCQRSTMPNNDQILEQDSDKRQSIPYYSSNNGSNQFYRCFDYVENSNLKRKEYPHLLTNDLYADLYTLKHGTANTRSCIKDAIELINNGDSIAESRLINFIQKQLAEYQSGLRDETVFIFFRYLRQVPSKEAFELVLVQAERNYMVGDDNSDVRSMNVGIRAMMDNLMPMIPLNDGRRKYVNLYIDLLRQGTKKEVSANYEKYVEYLTEVIHPQLFSSIKSDWEAGMIKLIERPNNKN